jgi:pimeloyl-ACP methyl ester carboxylesterase
VPAIEHEGEHIAYEEFGVGQADTVVLTHGMGGNRASWWQQVPAFADRYRTVVWDQRGFGGSTRRTGTIGPLAAAGDLAALLDALGVERAHVVGQSMGGWTALAFAVACPGRVRSLVLTDTLAGLGPAPVPTIPPPESPFSHPALAPATVARRPDLAALYRLLAGFGDKAPDEEVFGLLGSTRFTDHEVARVAAPVLFVVGADDVLCPPAVVRGLAARIPHAHVVELPGAGHSPYFETPDAWNDVVLGFLAKAAP